eukprot:scaffold107958_cov22-Tisochrysis_lutea.AAC.2
MLLIGADKVWTSKKQSSLEVRSCADGLLKNNSISIAGAGGVSDTNSSGPKEDRQLTRMAPLVTGGLLLCLKKLTYLET